MVAQMAKYLPPVDTDGVTVSERAVPGPAADVPVRLYRPSAQATSESLPVMVFAHWGGFVLGTLDTEHARCVRLARDARIAVVSVDYRLAPEHPYPSGLDDVYAVLEWVTNEGDQYGLNPQRLAVGGTSAGAGLAAAAALRARDEQGPTIVFQYLGYPVLDHRCATPSASGYPGTPNWSSPANQLMWKYYLRGPADAYASPSLSENLRDLPPAFIWTAEFDPLRDEGVAYAAALLAAGNATEFHHYPGTSHGFDGLPVSTGVVSRAHESQVDALRRAMHESTLV